MRGIAHCRPNHRMNASATRIMKESWFMDHAATGLRIKTKTVNGGTTWGGPLITSQPTGSHSYPRRQIHEL